MSDGETALAIRTVAVCGRSRRPPIRLTATWELPLDGKKQALVQSDARAKQAARKLRAARRANFRSGRRPGDRPRDGLAAARPERPPDASDRCIPSL